MWKVQNVRVKLNVVEKKGSSGNKGIVVLQ